MVNIYDNNLYLNKWHLMSEGRNKLTKSKFNIYSKDHAYLKDNFTYAFEKKELIPIRRFKLVRWLLEICSKYHKEKHERLACSKMLKQLKDYNQSGVKDTIEYLKIPKQGGPKKPFYKKNVVFGYTNTEKYGRYYSEKNSVQRLSNNLRYLLFENTYFDVDLRSSHFSILYQYSVEKGFDDRLKVLPKYVKNRDEFILNVSKELKSFSSLKLIGDPLKNSSLDLLCKAVLVDLKKKFIIYSNKNPSGEEDTGGLFGIAMQYVLDFQKDIQLIRNLLDQDPLLENLKNFAHSRKSNDYLITLQNFYGYYIENKILDIAKYKCESEGINNTIPMFDGLLISKENFEGKEAENLFIKELNETVKFKYPYITFFRKEMKSDKAYLGALNLNDLEYRFNKHYPSVKMQTSTQFKNNESHITKHTDYTVSELQQTINMPERFKRYSKLYKGIETITQIKILEFIPILHPFLDMEAVKASK